MKEKPAALVLVRTLFGLDGAGRLVEQVHAALEELRLDQRPVLEVGERGALLGREQLPLGVRLAREVAQHRLRRLHQKVVVVELVDHRAAAGRLAAALPLRVRTTDRTGELECGARVVHQWLQLQLQRGCRSECAVRCAMCAVVRAHRVAVVGDGRAGVGVGDELVGAGHVARAPVHVDELPAAGGGQVERVPRVRERRRRALAGREPVAHAEVDALRVPDHRHAVHARVPARTTHTTLSHHITHKARIPPAK